MPTLFHGQTIVFAINDDWMPDPSLPPNLSQQFLTYRYVPTSSYRDGIMYGSMQIREVPDPMEKVGLASQLQMLTNPVMATSILANLGVRPQSMVDGIQHIEINGNECEYRILDAVSMFTMQPVRCYIGLIDMGMWAVEIIAVTMVQAWPLLLPQILETFTSIYSTAGGKQPEVVERSPIYVHQDEEGNVAYKVRQSDGSLKEFDSQPVVNVNIENFNYLNRSVSVGKDVEILGPINTGSNNNMNVEEHTMSDRRIMGNVTGDVFSGDNAHVDKSTHGAVDTVEFSKAIEEILAAIQQSGATDPHAKIATNELEKARLQADAGESREQVASSVSTAAEYLKKSEEVVKSGVNIVGLLAKAAKIVGAVVAWL